MRIIILRFTQAFNHVRLQNQSCAMSQASRTLNVQPKRYYKNFGHREEGDPPSKMLWFGFGIFVAVLGSLRCFQ